MSNLPHGQKKAPSLFRKRINYISITVLLLTIQAAALLLIASEQASALADTASPAYLASSFDPHEQVGHDHSASSRADSGITAGQLIFYAVRSAYYLALSLAAGLMLWSVAIPAEADAVQRKLLDKWGLPAMRGLLLVILLFVFVHMSELLKGYTGGSPREWLRLLTETSPGRSWLALILLSFIGFAALKLKDSFKALWALLLLAVESFNGHVNALPSNTLAIVLDFIHLVCSALWAGGLMLLLLFWRSERKEAGRFAGKFTQMAWLTILLLTLSGVGMTFLLLPSWRYLLYTTWGNLLLAKGLLVLLVIGTGYLLRRRVKRHELPRGGLLKLDGVLMCLIIIIASLFTYMSPVPDTEPLSYHKMGDKLHYTLGITPNGPGPNRLTLKVWLPEQLGAPASVQLVLRADRYPGRAGIEVPLLSDFSGSELSFPGFKETAFYADKVDLYTRGAWTAELVIIDKAGGETKQSIPFRND
ncbi:copper resistance D family protein [Paenibacillus harenae]|uniref:copper resistance D family protein n=1 Tax=Paenibacillus harenae TaxID=306543 RepID=UPI00041EFACD|nr:CopD family protein [Paenibacillus harenae]